MYIRYPARNFKCPFCGTKLPTDEYRGWKPWLCPGCSAKLQFSDSYGWIVQLAFFMAALLSAFLLTVLLIEPLTAIFPPGLEAYRVPPWKQEKFVRLVPKEASSGI